MHDVAADLLDILGLGLLPVLRADQECIDPVVQHTSKDPVLQVLRAGKTVQDLIAHDLSVQMMVLSGTDLFDQRNIMQQGP